MASDTKQTDNLPIERTVVVLKPDGVFRGLIGEIISRFEKKGLKMVAAKMIWVDQDLVGKHYADDKEYLTGVGEKCLEKYEKYGMDAGEKLGTMDPYEVGKLVRKWNMDYLTKGPVFAMILEAPHAVELVRKMIGFTFPQNAEPGTIRGDLTGDSTFLSNTLKRSVKNLVHSSGSVEEANFEIQLWFREHEIHSYKRVDEDMIWGE